MSSARWIEGTKALVNIRLGRDFLTLSSNLSSLAGVPLTFVIPTQVVKRMLYRVRPNCIFFADLIGEGGVINVENHDTSKFIHEMVTQRKPYRDTTLYGQVMSGSMRRYGSMRPYVNDQRTIGNIRKRNLKYDQDVRVYYDRYFSLYQFIRQHGLLDLHLWYGDRFEGKYDQHISVGIYHDGALIHWLKGHHRLAIVRELGMESIPVRVAAVSGRYLLSFLRPYRFLSLSSMFSAIRLAVDHAVTSAGGKILEVARGTDEYVFGAPHHTRR